MASRVPPKSSIVRNSARFDWVFKFQIETIDSNSAAAKTSPDHEAAKWRMAESLIWLSSRFRRVFKQPHLCRRTNRQIFRADRQETHAVIEARGNTICPSLKLRARPLEAMVTVTKLSSGK